MRGARLVIWTAVAAICLSPAAADDATDCGNPSVDAAQRIAACSTVITSDGLDVSAKSQALNNRGHAYHDIKDFGHALADFDEAIKIDPGNADAFNKRGNLYWSKFEDDRAFQDFSDAIRIAPRAEYFLNRGDKYSLLGDDDRAISDFDQAITLNSQLAVAYRYRGAAYSRKNDFARAMQEYDRSVQIDPRSAVLFNKRLLHDADAEHVKDVAGYGRMLVARSVIQRRYPRLAVKGHTEGAVMLLFTVNRRGSVTTAQIVSSSGSPVLDEEALAMIKRAQPFPPLPDRKAKHDFQLPVRFRIVELPKQ
jgi:TonB family protein